MGHRMLERDLVDEPNTPAGQERQEEDRTPEEDSARQTCPGDVILPWHFAASSRIPKISSSGPPRNAARLREGIPA